MKFNKLPYYFVGIIAAALSGCGASGDNPGVEYAPNMYHTVAYDPLSQIVDSTDKYYNTINANDFDGKYPTNMLKPVEGTIARQNFSSVTKTNANTEDQPLYFYNIHKDSIEMASAMLKNPIVLGKDSAAIVERGKELYTSFCSPCHGEKGDGQGKVGAVYKGVPNYSKGRYATMTEGHIFHVITHGRNTMWSHKSQIAPEDRWKIVHYVQTLQKGS